MNENQSFYKSKRWELLRENILRRDGYMCQDRKRYGKRIEATQVHHILPREQFPEYQWQPWNLISLSKQAHNEMHYRGDRTLTAKGKELARRTISKYNRDHVEPLPFDIDINKL